MLAIDERPNTFKDVIGQDLVKKTLLNIVKHPKESPHIILLSGPHGVGKTSIARIFTKALNCPNRLSNGDACGKEDCPICGSSIDDSIFYNEYDSAIVGNVDTIKELRNTFYFGYEEGYKVITFDETQLISRQAQSALLKVFENPEPNVFFILCTTDKDKLLQTIISRSLILDFSKIDDNTMKSYLLSVVDKYRDKFLISDEEIEINIDKIVARASGHVREALMLLDNMQLLQEEFKNSIKDIEKSYLQILIIGLNLNKINKKYGNEEVKKNIDNIIKELVISPVNELKIEYEKFVLNIIKYIYNIEDNDKYSKVLSRYKYNNKLVNTLNDKVIYNLFSDDIQFQIAIMILIERLSKIGE